jgi:hypothetical protein
MALTDPMRPLLADVDPNYALVLLGAMRRVAETGRGDAGRCRGSAFGPMGHLR